MKRRVGETIQWRTLYDREFFEARVEAVAEGRILLRLITSPPRGLETGQEIIIRRGIDDFYTNVVEVMEGAVSVRPVWAEQRRYFRVDDAFAVTIRKLEDQAPELKSRVFPAYGIEVRGVDIPKPPGGINLRLWRVLNRINSSLGMALYFMEMADKEIPDDRENPHVWKALETVDRKLSYILQELGISKHKLIRSERRRVNLSAAGIRFMVREQVVPGDTVELKILLPSSPPVGILTLAKVVRAVKTEDGLYDVALDYTDMDEQVREQLITYALNRQREIIRSHREAAL